jgi:hypothetical protein
MRTATATSLADGVGLHDSVCFGDQEDRRPVSAAGLQSHRTAPRRICGIGDVPDHSP